MNTGNLNEVTKQMSEKYPHYNTYKKCQSQTFMTGLFTFATGTAAAYLVQDVLKAKLPYEKKSILMVSLGVASIISYFVTRKNTKLCQEMWMALEDKHTAINPIEGVF
ncbi:hypothetical protein SNE40_001226 [Patella caerulea]|uniref:Transmembrane protein 141 n=1 Tax=Patella caerulea TaxID=87958 RepID=A0AAN8KI76_PATCE